MAGKSRQRGVSLFTLIFFLAVIGVVGAVGMRAFPSILEYQAALKAINRAKDEATVAGVRNAFDRAAQVDNITSITSKDLEITKDGDKVVVSFAYEKEFQLFGPAWLTLKYAGTSHPGR
ncbi:DUF4845 domain-containing protein [Ramlibacter sp. AN1133]|uniref:DUF4845 domain-containing protein n=1 Tax=Ramlibacter sp. AN1133 TaxID=3133429 RepID=UPI0030BAAE73